MLTHRGSVCPLAHARGYNPARKCGDSVQFSAYDGMQWNNAWDTTDTTSVNTNLPLAVRVDIQLNGGRGRNMPPIEILVPIDSQSRSNSTSTVGS